MQNLDPDTFPEPAEEIARIAKKLCEQPTDLPRPRPQTIGDLLDEEITDSQGQLSSAAPNDVRGIRELTRFRDTLMFVRNLSQNSSTEHPSAETLQSGLESINKEAKYVEDLRINTSLEVEHPHYLENLSTAQMGDLQTHAKIAKSRQNPPDYSPPTNDQLLEAARERTASFCTELGQEAKSWREIGKAVEGICTQLDITPLHHDLDPVFSIDPPPIASQIQVLAAMQTQDQVRDKLGTMLDTNIKEFLKANNQSDTAIRSFLQHYSIAQNESVYDAILNLITPEDGADYKGFNAITDFVYDGHPVPTPKDYEKAQIALVKTMVHQSHGGPEQQGLEAFYAAVNQTLDKQQKIAQCQLDSGSEGRTR